MAPVMLQIRNLPDALHRQLKIRAAEEGVSMSDWVTARIEEALDRPSRDQVLARLRSLEPVDVDPAEIIRDLRGPLLAAEEGPSYSGSASQTSSEGEES